MSSLTAARPVRRPGAELQRRRTAITGWMFVSPALLLFLVFVAGPFVFAIVLAFLKWDMLTQPEFVGLDNFATLFSDPILPQVLLNTFVFAFASIVTHLVFGLLLALAVNRVASRVLSYFARVAIFFPFLISWAAVALLWKYVLDPTFGYVAQYAAGFGIELPNFFADPAWAMPAIIFIDLWHTVGFTFIIMLAGLQTVPGELVEAARTDGATSWQVFWNVTLPLMSPTLFFATIITFIGAFQIFDPIQIITKGGPQNSTTTIIMYLYEKGFQAFDMGYAAAVALLVFLIIMGVTVLQFLGRRKWVHES
ncbi:MULTISPECIES: carbohydrate ABC transporter permease [unclassified Microbacterium]|uniref:carbohydrate ABC transporter permease n=1 Tax=unclassified Microbacterium TaxID=2609290 RepID=UPI00191E43AB|nr:MULTISPECIES: sugar ABC transporter permease [unclassified Microbacterium]QYM64149.1 sugar ABC transporter permease [Microbacterium sp. Se5.02b]